VSGNLNTHRPIVETSAGKVRGLVEDGACVFKGIRYGAPTGGGGRFRAPRTAGPWAGVIEATTWSASAPQNVLAWHNDPFLAWYGTIPPPSEDCLFLNVFTPGLEGRRPVMVWLHGGGWGNFASSAPGFHGGRLAAAEDVVVVSPNHRLNAFGFIRLEGDDERFADSGAAGLLDLVLALRWVRDNAEAFGGDPGNVTVFGQSGGAAKVAALMAMPEAAGLFHKAIIQSTSGGTRIAGPAEAAAMTRSLGQALGLAAASGHAMQALSMERLLQGLAVAPGPFRPVIDGRHCLGDPFFPAAPAASAGIPLLVGSTATETTHYLRGNPANFALGIGEVEQRLMRFLRIDEAEVRRILTAYRDQDPTASASDLLIAVTTDHLFTRNGLAIAALQAETGASVFAYRFARPTPVEGGRLGAPHSGELPFIFGTTDVAAAAVGPPETPDIAPMTRLMMATWAAFARTGDPNNETVPRWRRYAAEDRQVMILGPESALSLDPGGAARRALEGLPCYEYSNSRATFAA
jgi:para-nitrobenzyl esterase